MGQAASKKTGAARKLRLPRTAQQQPKQAVPEDQKANSRLLTRDEMLKETDQQDQRDQKLAENLKYFLNPKELLTPITPTDPSKNINVQALRSRREDDDVEVVGKMNRVKSAQIARLLCELEKNESAEQMAAKYGLDKGAVTQLAKFLSPV
ncbi:hypothetical protein IW140_005730 [Coemansia sp. RSA 1813]|nr:hypothetical protein EV178_005784 [Coemansia sp. RSA 1646]KAJ1767977.1 hypothetical protein LPJ74_005067 [Coemansia sp. RSA 1843]KAJ2086413.1 hypothetical protein IW138_005697 [Coemansia sp. RSA 986]KAJ2211249.1 hypothetical protein EV179_005660 [Coemansia sp. RSA 487]KAJ2564467.1 hypothetical protein IW140_005730 [Coemansia sp. RSA 1813]